MWLDTGKQRGKPPPEKVPGLPSLQCVLTGWPIPELSTQEENHPEWQAHTGKLSLAQHVTGDWITPAAKQLHFLVVGWLVG